MRKCHLDLLDVPRAEIADLYRLRGEDVAAFRDDLRVAGVSVPTVRKILGTLQFVLGYAIALDLVAVNVARGVQGDRAARRRRTAHRAAEQADVAPASECGRP